MTEWTEEQVRQFVTENGYLPALVATSELKFDFFHDLILSNQLVSKVIYDRDIGELIVLFVSNNVPHVVHYVSANTALLVTEDSNEVIGMMIEFNANNNIEII